MLKKYINSNDNFLYYDEITYYIIMVKKSRFGWLNNELVDRLIDKNIEYMCHNKILGISRRLLTSKSAINANINCGNIKYSMKHVPIVAPPIKISIKTQIKKHLD